MESGAISERVRGEISGRKLVSKGEPVVVGVSGGLDSMVLLQLLKSLAEEFHWPITAAHFNHQLRGKSSDADERLVRNSAKKLGVGIAVEAGDVTGLAKRKGISLEMAGRELRHAFFAGVARKVGAKRVALAHHADDQVELYFLRWLRGSGTTGLGGMNWISKSPADETISLIRPLLNLTKTELAEYARVEKIAHREDASNGDLDFARNRIRHELLPLLKAEYQPAVQKVVLRQMELARAENEYLEQQASDYFDKGLSFEDAPVALQRRFLQQQLIKLGVRGEFQLIENLRLQADKMIEIQPDVRVSRGVDGSLVVQNRDALAKSDFFESKPVSQTLKLSGKRGGAAFDNVKLEWEVSGYKNGTVPARKVRLNQELFDGAKVGPEVSLRHWQPGDRFQPLGFERSTKLQDLFVNRKIPKSQRHEKLVAERAGGEIFWVEGFAPGERFKLDKSSRYVLKWCWERL